MRQSDDVILALFDEYQMGFAPPDLIHSEKNAAAMLEYTIQKFGLVSISYLIDAERTLGSQLERVPPPKKLTQGELAAAENAKQHSDYMKSIAPQESFDAKVAKEKVKRQAALQAKAQADARGQLQSVIEGYQCYRTAGNGIDYGATEMVKSDLRTVKFGNDFVRTLIVVRRIIELLPDHPKAGDATKVVESLNAQLK
jgi:hypothetical protein